MFAEYNDVELDPSLQKWKNTDFLGKKLVKMEEAIYCFFYV